MHYSHHIATSLIMLLTGRDREIDNLLIAATQEYEGKYINTTIQFYVDTFRCNSYGQ